MATAEGTLGTWVPGVPKDCSSDDAHAMGRGPLAILRQVVAACAYPELLGNPTVPEGARHRARRVLGEMDAGNIGGYNHEHRGLGVPTRVARFLQRRDGGVPCHPHNIVLCSGTSSILPGQQERAFLPERPFLSFKRVLWEMGAPFSSTVQLISFYSLSKSVAGESGFRAGFLELVNVEEDVVLPFQLAQSIPRPCVLGRVLLDLLMDPLEEGDPVQKALEERQGLLQDLAHNARLVQEVLGRAPGIHCPPLQGGARAFPRIQLPPRAQRQARELGLEPDVFFCQKLQEATGMVVAPGSEFGQMEGTHHLVLSLLPPAATLEQILLTLTQFYTTFLHQFS
ncbi:PREDICTED: alanine aminotransferase 1-like [Calidris pugnax]|uniref:alanine aminotransferase 1-like n=1 Tax=Calidris pugnax TaxID=198806 RepID=UPI00071D3C50|nr:PREDICTED: alanine aminotransferase 1-like [Calidris pugnax]